jgi:hypothetical protein
VLDIRESEGTQQNPLNIPVKKEISDSLSLSTITLQLAIASSCLQKYLSLFQTEVLNAMKKAVMVVWVVIPCGLL